MTHNTLQGLFRPNSGKKVTRSFQSCVVEMLMLSNWFAFGVHCFGWQIFALLNVFQEDFAVMRQSPHNISCVRLIFSPKSEVSLSIGRLNHQKMCSEAIGWFWNHRKNELWTSAIWRFACGLAALWSFVTYHSWQKQLQTVA